MAAGATPARTASARTDADEDDPRAAGITTDASREARPALRVARVDDSPRRRVHPAPQAERLVEDEGAAARSRGGSPHALVADDAARPRPTRSILGGREHHLRADVAGGVVGPLARVGHDRRRPVRAGSARCSCTCRRAARRPPRGVGRDARARRRSRTSRPVETRHSTPGWTRRPSRRSRVRARSSASDAWAFRSRRRRARSPARGRQLVARALRSSARVICSSPRAAVLERRHEGRRLRRRARRHGTSRPHPTTRPPRRAP